MVNVTRFFIGLLAVARLYWIITLIMTILIFVKFNTQINSALQLHVPGRLNSVALWGSLVLFVLCVFKIPEVNPFRLHAASNDALSYLSAIICFITAIVATVTLNKQTEPITRTDHGIMVALWMGFAISMTEIIFKYKAFGPYSNRSRHDNRPRYSSVDSENSLFQNMANVMTNAEKSLEDLFLIRREAAARGESVRVDDLVDQIRQRNLRERRGDAFDNLAHGNLSERDPIQYESL